MPEDIHHDTLDTRSPKDKSEAYEDEKPAAKPRKCGNCFAVIPPKTRACPACGDVYEAPNRTEHVPGELTLLESTPRLKKGKQEPTPSEKDRFYAELISVTDARGWKRGAADHAFKEKFGHFPARKHGISPVAPSAAVTGFLRHLQIKRIKSQQKVKESA